MRKDTKELQPGMRVTIKDSSRSTGKVRAIYTGEAPSLTGGVLLTVRIGKTEKTISKDMIIR